MRDQIVELERVAGERGSGRRLANGIYAECDLRKYGSPVESYLFDPPVSVPPDLAVDPFQARLLQTSLLIGGVRRAVVHVVDWIASANYLNVADFIEEARLLGVSRLLGSDLDFSLLTKESRLILVHSRAMIANALAYTQDRQCPKGKKHKAGVQCCGLWWEDIHDGDPLDGSRAVVRQTKSVQYLGLAAPTAVVPDYAPGFFASFPISRLVAVAGDRTEEQLAKLRRSALPTAIVPN